MKRTKQNQPVTILTNDPSMTAWGWAVVTQYGKVIEAGAIKTAPSPQKLHIRKGDDRIRRIKEINEQLLDIIETHNVKFIISEQPHGSQSAVAAIMIGMTAGIVQTIGDCREIAVEWFSEAEAKKSISGRRSVGKDEMVDLISKKYDVIWRGVKWHDQAVADAMAVYHAASQQSELLKLLR
jgi:Holliday junction resolvasome RuvABC endonuclease subunit